MDQVDFVALGYCSNDYLAILPEIPLDGKVQILEQLNIVYMVILLGQKKWKVVVKLQLQINQ